MARHIVLENKRYKELLGFQSTQHGLSEIRDTQLVKDVHALRRGLELERDLCTTIINHLHDHLEHGGRGEAKTAIAKSGPAKGEAGQKGGQKTGDSSAGGVMSSPAAVGGAAGGPMSSPGEGVPLSATSPEPFREGAHEAQPEEEDYGAEGFAGPFREGAHEAQPEDEDYAEGFEGSHFAEDKQTGVYFLSC